MGPLSAAACFACCRKRRARRTFSRANAEARGRAAERGVMSDATIFAHWLCVSDLRRQPLGFYASLVAFLKSQDVFHWKHLADIDADFCRPLLSPRSADVVTRRRACLPLLAVRGGRAQGRQRGKIAERHACSRGLLIWPVQAVQRGRGIVAAAPGGHWGLGGAGWAAGSPGAMPSSRPSARRLRRVRRGAPAASARAATWLAARPWGRDQLGGAGATVRATVPQQCRCGLRDGPACSRGG